jgi:hypothetical protein
MKLHPKATTKKAREDAAAHEKLAQVAQQSLDQTAAVEPPKPVTRASARN